MVDVVRGRGVSDYRVLDAMGRVPRHLFVPEKVRPQAYEDFPLPIGIATDDLAALHRGADDLARWT